ncbi:hypothetical protein [Streptomyces sp. SID3343]|uniref:hypothetical protein n=1 Tax=Streptomyces sp. SID3343 TaxID=2690260 RepID=UPI0031F72664
MAGGLVVTGALVAGLLVAGLVVGGLLVAGAEVAGLLVGGFVVTGTVDGAALVLGGVCDGVAAGAVLSAPGVVGALVIGEGADEAAPASAFVSVDPELHADRARIAVTVSARDMRVFFMNWCLSGPYVDVPESCTPCGHHFGAREAACLV